MRKGFVIWALLLLLGSLALPSGAAPVAPTETIPTRLLAGGLLPIAANEYWLGSQGHCPYDNCGAPYSFVRDPYAPPPFSSTDGGVTWQRNRCRSIGPEPRVDDTCQGPYDGAGENVGRAFAVLGFDAPPTAGSSNPRGAVELDYRYDALLAAGTWHWLITSSQWLHDVAPITDGQGKDMMAAVLAAGGYALTPLPQSVREPPSAYVDEWGYCWGTPPTGCFNYPESGRAEPYDSLQFLSGATGVFLAQYMYDGGNYLGGRYAPGQRIVTAVFDGYAGAQWGPSGKRADNAVLVGYVGLVIVGYGNTFDPYCAGTPGDWQSFAPCISGTPNTLYGLVVPGGELRADPTWLLQHFLPPSAELDGAAIRE